MPQLSPSSRPSGICVRLVLDLICDGERLFLGSHRMNRNQTDARNCNRGDIDKLFHGVLLGFAGLEFDLHGLTRDESRPAALGFEQLGNVENNGTFCNNPATRDRVSSHLLSRSTLPDKRVRNRRFDEPIHAAIPPELTLDGVLLASIGGICPLQTDIRPCCPNFMLSRPNFLCNIDFSPNRCSNHWTASQSRGSQIP
jgi:hypothetical protein